MNAPYSEAHHPKEIWRDYRVHPSVMRAECSCGRREGARRILELVKKLRQHAEEAS